MYMIRDVKRKFHLWWHSRNTALVALYVGSLVKEESANSLLRGFNCVCGLSIQNEWCTAVIKSNSHRLTIASRARFSGCSWFRNRRAFPAHDSLSSAHGEQSTAAFL